MQKGSAKALDQGFAGILGKAGKVRESMDGARGRTRTDTLSPTGDFESPASTNFATRALQVPDCVSESVCEEAMAAKYREAMTVGQSPCMTKNTLSGKLAAFFNAASL